MRRTLDWLIEWGKRIAAVCLMGMMFLTCVDVTARYLGYPIFGTYEITGFTLVLVVGLSVGYTQRSKRHIAIDTLVLRLPQRARAITDTVTCLLTIGIVGLVIWQCVVLGTHLWEVNQLSMSLMVPLFPFLYALAFAFTLMWLRLWLDLANILRGLIRK